MDKIKAFFQNKWTQLVAWILLILSSVVLIIAGVSAKEIGDGVLLVSGIIEAVALLVAFVGKHLLVKKD